MSDWAERRPWSLSTRDPRDQSVPHTDLDDRINAWAASYVPCSIVINAQYATEPPAELEILCTTCDIDLIPAKTSISSLTLNELNVLCLEHIQGRFKGEASGPTTSG